MEQGEGEGEVKQTDLRKLIKSGESETVELKASFNKEILETSGAFANTKGGVILIGISDRGEIKRNSDWKRNVERLGKPDFSEHRTSHYP